MTPAPILVPNEPPPRFIWGGVAHAVERLPVARVVDVASFFGSAPERLYESTEFHTVERGAYRSPRLGWQGYVFARREDTERLLDVLRLAEVAILFVDWLRDFTPRVSKPGL